MISFGLLFVCPSGCLRRAFCSCVFLHGLVLGKLRRSCKGWCVSVFWLAYDLRLQADRDLADRCRYQVWYDLDHVRGLRRAVWEQLLPWTWDFGG